MNLANLEGDEKLFVARIRDIIRLSSESGRARFSHFLTERQVLLAAEAAGQQKCDTFRLYGGYEGAGRVMLGAFSPYEEPEDRLFPIQGIQITYKKEFSLSHRDFLGSLMGLKISRESVGDILPGTGECTLFVLESVAPTVLSELDKVGRVGVKCKPALAGSVAFEPSFMPVSGTVKSPRLDSMVALLTGQSRGKSADLIKAGQVSVAGAPCLELTRECLPGESISIRGIGKFILDDIGGLSKKGRLHIQCRKYL
ncbi:YlmH/Sll1252 family protein [Oscillospiraceae bacterium MB08-C2-2]|nr:YlmH/Sll1252 family protein [Oscillospiraceae bacterium MB08-C2-2]